METTRRLTRLTAAAAALGLAVAAALAAWLTLPGPRHRGPLPPAGAGNTKLAAELRRDVEIMCLEIGERSHQRPENLARTAGWLARAFKAAGLRVERQRYEAEGGPFENVVGVRPGRPTGRGGRNRGAIVIGAHYDSFPGTLGADDNASGVAAMLAIARALGATEPARELRFVGFATEETHFQTEGMGSLVYARRCRAAGDDVVGMLSLETLGTYADGPGTQRFPLEPLAWLFPDRGDFVAFVGDPRSRPLLAQVVGAFRQAAPFPAEGVALPADVPGVGWSDHWAFWQVGYPAVMATDTAPYRNPRYHTPQDRPDRLDYERLARVTGGLIATVETLLGAP